MKFDGVVLQYGTFLKYLIATNFPITTSDSVTWEPLLVSGVSLELSGIDKKEAMTLKLLREKVPDLVNFLVHHAGNVYVKAVEVDAAVGNWSAFYEGYVTKFKVDLHYVELTVESMVSLGIRSANRIRLSIGCIRNLNECGVDWDSYSALCRVTAISGKTISYVILSRGANFPDPVPVDWLKYGKAVTLTETKTIVGNSGGDFTVRFRFVELEVGDTVTVYAGCNKSVSTCRDKFNNLDNFLGFPYTPTESSVLRGRQGKTPSGKK